MRTAYIHIGLEKTGTTTLQHFLSANSALLRERGYLYPCDPSKPYFTNQAHFPVAGCLLDQCPEFLSREDHRSPETVLSSLSVDLQESALDVILSCEHFSSRLAHRDQLQMIKESVPVDQFRIVCYLRRQDELALALYTTAVRVGYTHSFHAQGIRPSDRFFNYAEILDLWASIFGRDNVIVRIYDRERLRNRDICSDFLWQIGLGDAMGWEHLDDRNLSLDAKQAEMLRRINEHLPTFSPAHREEYERGQEISRRVIEFLPRGPSIRSLLSNSERKEILARFDDVNRSVAERYLGDRDALAGWYSSDLTADSESDRGLGSAVTLSDFAQAVVRIAALLADSDVRIARAEAASGSRFWPFLVRARATVRHLLRKHFAPRRGA